MATFFNESSKHAEDLGIAASNDVSKRLLQKIEFADIMKKQTQPVNDLSLDEEASFQYAKQISRRIDLGRPLFDIQSDRL